MPYYKIKRQAAGPKKTAWNWFAKYIKLRDALVTTNTPERARCITCGDIYPIEDMDAGHMIPGRTGGILFDEEITHAQCRKCNRDGNGEKQAYRLVMVARHGEAWYAMKLAARKTNTKLGDFECQLIGEEYKKRYKALLATYQEQQK